MKIAISLPQLHIRHAFTEVQYVHNWQFSQLDSPSIPHRPWSCHRTQSCWSSSQGRLCTLRLYLRDDVSEWFSNLYISHGSLNVSLKFQMIRIITAHLILNDIFKEYIFLRDFRNNSPSFSLKFEWRSRVIGPWIDMSVFRWFQLDLLNIYFISSIINIKYKLIQN